MMINNSSPILKTGVIGAGHLGKIHLKLLKEISSFSVQGFYDSDPANAAQVKSQFSLQSFSSPEELIENTDAVVLVTPTITHFPLAVKALKKGKHLFIEKPMCSSLHEARLLVRLAEEASVKVQIGHVERFNPAFVAAKKYLNSPLFIETHRLAQFNPRGTDVSVVLDLMIHDIDIVLSVVKSEIKRISASGVAVISDSPDIANARLEFHNGAVANITASRISMKNMRKSRFFQKDAYISVDFLQKKTEIIRLKPITEIPSDPFAMVLDLKEKGMKQIFFENPSIEETNAIRSELQAFAHSILNDTTPEISAADGALAMDIAYRIIKKMPFVN